MKQDKEKIPGTRQRKCTSQFERMQENTKERRPEIKPNGKNDLRKKKRNKKG